MKPEQAAREDIDRLRLSLNDQMLVMKHAA